MFEVGDELLIVASDRISAYDLVLGSVIPNKGKVLTQLSAFWFDRTRHIVPNHMHSVDPQNYPDALRRHAELLAGRSMLVRRARPLPIECVARGYLAGSGWKEYKETGRVCGVTLPPGLRESDRLPQPIFTPATKAENGHDLNITETEAAAAVGHPLIEQLRELTLSLYSYGAAHAEARGVLLADTKFEFGLPLDSTSDEVLLIDEILTPDSSRFWPLDRYKPGVPQLSFDKQYVRDYLDSIKWNRQPPVPDLPADVVAKTSEKYLEAYRALTGQALT
jgi:phosphoribosylaminoimidazole-succinocarboxamide synthase